jgi:probable rRNA maturation factor
MGAITVVVRDPRGQRIAASCRRLLGRLVKETPESSASVTLLLTSDSAVRALNRRFRGVDRVTDVLAFPAGGDLEPGQPHLGDIAIAVPRAERQARRARWSLHSEMALLVTHGFLHLLGFDHETDDGTMQRREQDLLCRVSRRPLSRRGLPSGEPAPAPSRRRGGARRIRHAR